MIKKSRKILTLLLASLLIMSSMSALSVSAAAVSVKVQGENKVVTNAEGGSLSAEYEVSGSSVTETGWYQLQVSHTAKGAGNEASGKKYYAITAKIGDAEETDYIAVNNGGTYPIPGKFFLTAGEDFKVTLSYDFSNVTTQTTQETITLLNFTKVEPVKTVSSTEETKIHASDYISRRFRAHYQGGYNATTTIADGDEAGWAGHAILTATNYGVYRLNVPAKTAYDVYALVGTVAAGNFELYVDGSATANCSATIPNTGAQRIAAYSKLGAVVLDAGTHDLNFKYASGSGAVFFYGFKLVPATPHTLSATAMTAIDATSFVSGNPKSNASTSVATGVIEGTHTYIGFNNPELATYYSVNSAAEQKYSVSLVASRTLTQTFRITNETTGDYIEKEIGGTDDNFITAEYKIGEMTLPAGVSMLKLNAIDYNQKFIFEIRFTPVVESTFSAGEAEVVMSGDYEEVSVPINFTGSADVCGFQIDVAYDEDVKYVGYENGDILAGSLAVAQNGVVFANISGSDVAIANGTLATLKFEVPTQAANDFEISVTVAQVMKANGTEPAVEITGDFSAKNGVIKVVSPIKFTNGTTEVDTVVNGTMALEVDLSDASNANKNLVIFAIYSVNDGYAVLEDSQIATIDTANKKATATITDINLTSGVDYYAKAFVWNGTSYYGFSQTIGQ